MSNWVLLIVVISVSLVLWRALRTIGRTLAFRLEQVTDGVLEIEARVRRLEHHLLERAKTEGLDPLNFMDPNSGKPILSDPLIGAAKGIIRDVRSRDMLRRANPSGARQVEQLEELRDQVLSGTPVSEAQMNQAFGKR